MNPDKLQANKTYLVRLGRAGEEGVDWQAWEPRALHVMYVSKQKDPQNIALIAVAGVPAWAEYTPADYSAEHDTFEVEGYYMQVKETTDATH